MGAGAAGLASVVGCSSDGGSRQATPTPDGMQGGAGAPDILNPGGTPRAGGRFVNSEAADFGTFDPHAGIALASVYFPRLYNVLVNQSATKTDFMYFDLASSLETPDAQTFVFTIRPGVKITPNDLGVPERDLDGEDVRASIERIQQMPDASSHAFAREYIASVTPEGGTVTIRTTRPYAWFLNRIGLFFNTILPRELAAGDPEVLKQHAAGAGPFRLVSLVEGQSAQFERNPNYYRKDERTGQQLPYVDAIDQRIILDRATARAAFQSGQLHRYMPPDASEARALSSEYTIQRDPQFSYVQFTMNPQRKPFDDPRVRRAFSRAINRQQFVDTIYDGDAQANGLVHWPVGAYALDPEELASTYQPFDPAEARQLAEQAGGIKVRMTYPAETFLLQHDEHVPIFVAQMKEAGIDLELEPQALPQWIESYSKIDYQCSLALNQFYETAEIPLNFHTQDGPLGDGQYVRGLGDAEIEAAVKKTREILDIDERIEAVHDAQRLIYEKDPMALPLVSPYQYAAYQPVVHDIPSGVGTTQFLLNTWWLES